MLEVKLRLFRNFSYQYLNAAAAAAAKSLQSCLTLCHPIDGSPPGSSVPGILQPRILEWVAISFSNVCMHAKSLQSCPTLCNPVDGSPPGSHHPWDSPGKNTGMGCHFLLQCMKVKSESEAAQSCPTLSHPMDCSPPGSSIHGIFQARVLEWGAVAFSGKYICCCCCCCCKLQRVNGVCFLNSPCPYSLLC